MKTNILPASWGRRGGRGTSGVKDGRKLPLFFFSLFFFFFFFFFFFKLGRLSQNCMKNNVLKSSRSIHVGL